MQRDYKPTPKSRRLANKHFYNREVPHDIDFPGRDSDWDYCFDFCCPGLKDKIEASVAANFTTHDIAWGNLCTPLSECDSIIISNKKIADFIVDNFYDELLVYSWRWSNSVVGNKSAAIPLIAYWALYERPVFERYVKLIKY